MPVESFFGVLYAGFAGAVMFGKITRILSKAKVVWSDPLVVHYGLGVVIGRCTVGKTVASTGKSVASTVATNINTVGKTVASDVATNVNTVSNAVASLLKQSSLNAEG